MLQSCLICDQENQLRMTNDFGNLKFEILDVDSHIKFTELILPLNDSDILDMLTNILRKQFKKCDEGRQFQLSNFSSEKKSDQNFYFILKKLYETTYLHRLPQPLSLFYLYSICLSSLTK